LEIKKAMKTVTPWSFAIVLPLNSTKNEQLRIRQRWVLTIEIKTKQAQRRDSLLLLTSFLSIFIFLSLFLSCLPHPLFATEKLLTGFWKDILGLPTYNYRTEHYWRLWVRFPRICRWLQQM
jgi:hypothetical protein